MMRWAVAGRAASTGLAAGAAVPAAPRHASTAVAASAGGGAGVGWVLVRGVVCPASRRGLAGSAVLGRRGGRSAGGGTAAAAASAHDEHNGMLDPLDLALEVSRPSGRMPRYQDMGAANFDVSLAPFPHPVHVAWRRGVCARRC